MSKQELFKLIKALSDASRNVKKIKILSPKPIKSEDKEVIPPKIALVGIEKEPGWLYYVDKEGDIARVKMAKGRKKSKKKKISKTINKRIEKLEKKNKESKKRDEIIKKLLNQISSLEKRHSIIARDSNKKSHKELETKIKNLKKKVNQLKKQ